MQTLILSKTCRVREIDRMRTGVVVCHRSTMQSVSEDDVPTPGINYLARDEALRICDDQESVPPIVVPIRLYVVTIAYRSNRIGERNRHCIISRGSTTTRVTPNSTNFCSGFSDTADPVATTMFQDGAAVCRVSGRILALIRSFVSTDSHHRAIVPMRSGGIHRNNKIICAKQTTTGVRMSSSIYEVRPANGLRLFAPSPPQQTRLNNRDKTTMASPCQPSSLETASPFLTRGWVRGSSPIYSVLGKVD